MKQTLHTAKAEHFPGWNISYFYKYDLELAINLLYYLVIDKERRAVMTETSESNLWFFNILAQNQVWWKSALKALLQRLFLSSYFTSLSVWEISRGSRKMPTCDANFAHVKAQVALHASASLQETIHATHFRRKIRRITFGVRPTWRIYCHTLFPLLINSNLLPSM